MLLRLNRLDLDLQWKRVTGWVGGLFEVEERNQWDVAGDDMDGSGKLRLKRVSLVDWSITSFTRHLTFTDNLHFDDYISFTDQMGC